MVMAVKSTCTFWKIWTTREGLNEEPQVFCEKRGSLDSSVLEPVNRDEVCPPLGRLGHQQAVGKS